MNLMRWPLVLAMIFGVARWSTAQQVFKPDTTRTVSVTGRGSVTAVPDTASADVGVSVVDSDARKGKASVDASVARILSLARGLGIPEADVKTAAVNIWPRFDDTNRSHAREYEISQTVTVVIRDLSRLDEFLDGAVQAGANRDFNVTLSSSREVEWRQQAMKLAIDAAKVQAEAAARQLNLRLGAVWTITVNPTPGFVPLSLARAAAADAPRFLPGTLKVEADVAVVFLIEDR
jgi:uncharacterized protein YggE